MNELITRLFAVSGSAHAAVHTTHMRRVRDIDRFYHPKNIMLESEWERERARERERERRQSCYTCMLNCFSAGARYVYHSIGYIARLAPSPSHTRIQLVAAVRGCTAHYTEVFPELMLPPFPSVARGGSCCLLQCNGRFLVIHEIMRDIYIYIYIYI